MQPGQSPSKFGSHSDRCVNPVTKMTRNHGHDGGITGGLRNRCLSTFVTRRALSPVIGRHTRLEKGPNALYLTKLYAYRTGGTLKDRAANAKFPSCT
jgi:hypothetical protein